MKKTKSIIAAGLLTGIVLIGLLIMGMSSMNSLTAQDNSASFVEPTNIVIPQPEEQMAADQSLHAWQNYSAELEQAVQVMQDREAQYQAQIESANTTIKQLQDQINSANNTQNSTNPSRYFEDEAHEHEEHEYEEHEHEEHEYEEHEYDD